MDKATGKNTAGGVFKLNREKTLYMEYSFTWIESLSKNKPSTDFSEEGFVYITYRVISE